MNDRSTGNWSTGNWSTGNWSTGNWSTGNRSTGDFSTGNWSTGNWSTGNRSTGNWSISDCSCGHFSTEDYTGFSVFNKECTVQEWNNAIKPGFIYFDLTEWVQASSMTSEEKAYNKGYGINEGYLKVFEYKDAWKIAWNNATNEDKELLYNLPNFNAEVFKEISGIDVNVNVKEMTMDELNKMLGYKVSIIE